MTADDSPSGAAEPWPATAPLFLEVHQEGPDAVVIYVDGELDRAAAPNLASCLDELLATGSRCTTLIVDLTATTFLDVGGLNLLIEAQQQAAACGTRFGLAGCGRQVLRILEITEATKTLRLVPSHRASGDTAPAELPSSNPSAPWPW